MLDLEGVDSLVRLLDEHPWPDWSLRKRMHEVLGELRSRIEEIERTQAALEVEQCLARSLTVQRDRLTQALEKIAGLHGEEPWALRSIARHALEKDHA